LALAAGGTAVFFVAGAVNEMGMQDLDKQGEALGEVLAGAERHLQTLNELKEDSNIKKLEGEVSKHLREKKEQEQRRQQELKRLKERLTNEEAIDAEIARLMEMKKQGQLQKEKQK